MKFISSILKFVLYTFICLGISNLANAKITNFNYDAKNISNYFSALISFDNFDYKSSEKYFKKLNRLDGSKTNYSSKFIQSLINLEKYNEAVNYAEKLEKGKKLNFEANLIIGLSYLKKNDFKKADFYFSKIEPNLQHALITKTLKGSLKDWITIASSKDKKNIYQAIDSIKSKSGSFSTIQLAFANCYIDSEETESSFKNIFKNKKTELSRYHFFYANYLNNSKEFEKAKKVLNSAIENFPRNLLINQFNKILIKEEKNYNIFSCKNINHVTAEILYIISTALSLTGDYKLSNFYINLAKYLNPKFISYQSLLAENFVDLKKFDIAKNIYLRLQKAGSIYKWHSNKQIALILERQKKNDESVNYLLNAYKNINPSVYETFDLANFLRNKKKYEKSIEFYSKILLEIDKDHELYPKVLDRRGTAYERSNMWKLAEKDLLSSLAVSPNEPYVMNYLAYSWIENGENINKALRMLKKANQLKKNDGYITDSLGWALYKLKNYLESKKYLQLAIILMPTDPIVNDHYADCLWMNNKKIQARYYWNYVLTLEDVEDELKKNIKNKLLFGLERS